MNLQQLNSPLPKPWLDIACNKLTCNELVTPVQPVNTQLFQCYQSLPLPAVGSTTMICDTAEIVNPNFNIATNRYTAPSNQYVQVILKGNTAFGGTGGSASTTLSLTINGAVVNGQSVSSNVALNANGSLPISLVGVVRLNAGDVLGILVNNFVSATMISQFYSLCGLVV